MAVILIEKQHRSIFYFLFSVLAQCNVLNQCHVSTFVQLLSMAV